MMRSVNEVRVTEPSRRKVVQLTKEAEAPLVCNETGGDAMTHVLTTKYSYVYDRQTKTRN